MGKYSDLKNEIEGQDPEQAPYQPPTQIDPQLQPSPLLDTIMDLPRNAAGALLNAAQAPTFGWSDELMSLFPVGQQVEQFRQDWNRQNPGSALLAEGSGALLTGAAAPRALAAMPGPAQWLTGVGAGGLYGAGSAEPGERLPGAGIDAGIAAVAGPLGYYAYRGGQSLLNSAESFLRPYFTRAKTEGAEMLGRGRAAAEEPLDPEYLKNQVINTGPGGNRSTIAADLDAMSRAQLKAVYDTTPEARGRIEQLLIDRQRSAPERVLEDLTDITGMDRDSRRYIANAQEQAKRNWARQNYDEVYSQNIELTDDMLDLFLGSGEDLMKQAYRAAEKKAILRGDPIPKYVDVFGEDGSLEGLTPRAIDYMSRSMRDKAKNINTEGGADWAAFRDRFLEVADRDVPGFADARRAYATASSIEEAAEQGKKIYSMGDARDVSDYFYSLSEAEQQAFRRGALDAVENQVRNLGFKSGNVDTRLAGTVNKRDLLEIVFGENTDDVMNVLNREDMFNDTFSNVLGRSNTSRDIRGPAALGLSVDNIPGRLTTALSRALTETTGDMGSDRALNVAADILLDAGYTDEAIDGMARAGMLQQWIRQAGTGGGAASALLAPGYVSGAFNIGGGSE